MDKFINAIEKAITCKNWYAAIFMTLTLPDILGKIENPNLSSKSRYKKWFDKYMEKKYSGFLSSDDCYALRCSVLHEGSDKIKNQNSKDILDRFMFSISGSHCNSIRDCYFNGNKMDNALQLDVGIFCLDFCEQAKNWYQEVSGCEDIQKRLIDTIVINEESFSYGGFRFC